MTSTPGVPAAQKSGLLAQAPEFRMCPVGAWHHSLIRRSSPASLSRRRLMDAPCRNGMNFPAILVMSEAVSTWRAIHRNSLGFMGVVPVHVALDVDGSVEGEVRRRPVACLPPAVDLYVDTGEIAALPAHHAGVPRGVVIGSGDSAVVVQPDNFDVVDLHE